MFAKTAIATAVLVAFAAAAQAQDDASMFKISGFGTVALTSFSRNDIDFLGDRTATGGAGRTSLISMEPDTKFGLQAQYSPTAPLQFTLQALSRSNARGDWDPSIEWANAKYSFNDNVAVRIGRIGHPAFMISDYRLVNYTNVSLRPSVEVYQQVPMVNSDVIETLLKFDIDSGQLGIQTGFGKMDAEAFASLPSQRNHDDIKTRNMGYINATYEIGKWTMRAGYTRTDLTYDALAVRKGIFEQFGSNPLFGAAVRNARDRYEIRDAKSTFSGIGVMYDPGDVVINAEYVMLRSGKAYNDADAWMMLAGYRFGKFTPYVSYGSAKNKGRIMIDTPGLPSAIQTQLQAFADASLNNQATTSLGVRWDFYKNMAAKVQYDWIDVKTPGANGFLFNSANQTSTYAGGDGHALAISLDYIF